MSEPRTAHRFGGRSGDWSCSCGFVVSTVIGLQEHIRAEARADALRDAATAVEGLHTPLGMDVRLDRARDDALAAALDAIRALGERP